MRLFIAAELSPHSVDALDSVTQQLKAAAPGLKFTRKENLHFTLKFIGEAQESDLPGLRKTVSAVASKHASFRVTVEGLGYFGPRREPRVIWAGAHGGRSELRAISAELNEALVNFPREDREPFPHITLVRANGVTVSHGLIHMINEMSGVKVCEDVVKEIKLKKSVLNPSGSVYSDVAIFPLSKS